MRFTSIATQMGIIIFLGIWGGIQLDAYFGFKHTFTLTLSIIAVFLAIYIVIKDLSR